MYSDRLQSLNTWRKHTLKKHFYLKIYLGVLKSEKFVKSLDLEFSPCRIYQFCKNWAKTSKKNGLSTG